MRKMLVLAPHIDDETLGCGGTIAKYSEEDYYVEVVAFSNAWNSLPDGYSRDNIKTEYRNAARELGCCGHLLDFQTRVFASQRQEILDEMLYWKKAVDPDIVIAPSLYDIHQDHRVVAEEACRAFFDRTLWGFESIKKCKEFRAGVYVELSSDQIRKKIAAALCYNSQRVKEWFPGEPETIEAQARVRGMQINTDLAEAFQCIHTVIW